MDSTRESLGLRKNFLTNIDEDDDDENKVDSQLLYFLFLMP